MRKQLLLAFFAVLLASTPFLSYAADNDFEPEPLFDTVVVVKNIRIRLKSIEPQKFQQLFKEHAHKTAPSEPIMDIREVEKVLGPDFKLSYTFAPYSETDSIYAIHEVRYLNKMRIFLMENEGFTGYYPRERIFTYLGGHSSDQAFDIDTGESTFNPEHSRTAENKRFRVAGLHTGQDSVEYDFQKHDANTRKYVNLFSLYELGEYAAMGWMSYIYEQFFVGDTLLFRTGYHEDQYPAKKYIELTVLN